MQHIYGLFGFEFHLELSTRPDNYLGTIETWNQAEEVSPASLPLFSLFFAIELLYLILQTIHSNLNKHSRSIIQENGI
jgi:threonyl-tRNA synthetase